MGLARYLMYEDRTRSNFALREPFAFGMMGRVRKWKERHGQSQ